jgi:hemolysin activation/secretion protein
MQNRTTSSALPSTCLALAMLTMAMTLVPVAQAQDATTAAAKPRFDVLEYRVEGNTVLDSRVIERAIYGQLGPDKTIDDVNAARTALEQAYRDAGFPTVFVDVPEQEVDQGMVRLAVTEGRVSSLKISGSRYFSNGWIREQLPEATPGTVPRIDAFQAQLRALNQRSADRMLTPVLRPGAEQGTVEVEVKVQDQLPVNGSVTVNNRNSADTTDSRIEAALRYDNLWQRDHSAGLQYQVSPEDRDETSVISASYVLRPKASDKAFAFYALSSDSDIATVGGGVDVIGKGEVYGARAILPLSGSDGLYHSLSLGVDYKDFDDTVGFDDEGEEDIVTPISYLNWSLGWNATLPREARTHTGDLTLNFGVRDLGNEVDEFANKRFKGRPNYYYLEGSYGLVQALPWLETSLALSLRGQLTTQALISNEQFAAGGIDTVRGYYEGEVLGDYGVQASLEWRSPDIAGKFWRPADTLYVFGFFDSARLLLNDPLPGEQNYTLLSAGVGLRMQAEPFTAGLDVAVPFRDALSTEEGDERLLFSLRYGF